MDINAMISSRVGHDVNHFHDDTKDIRGHHYGR